MRYGHLGAAAAVVEQHLLVLVRQTVEVCIKAYYIDKECNDNYTFGTQLWRNLDNRIKRAIINNAIPLSIFGKKNEYMYSVANSPFRFHRVSRDSGLPNSARALKTYLEDNRRFLPFDDKDILGDYPYLNSIVGIEATPEDGLQRVFVGVCNQKMEKEDPELILLESLDVFNAANLVTREQKEKESDPIVIIKAYEDPA